MYPWVGIDVSMKTLDFAYIVEGKKFHKQVPNDREGFQQMLAEVPSDASFLMEATGTYYFNVALFLHQQGRIVSVVNPIRIKRFMEADMSRSKSDKADAFAIARFGSEKSPDPWQPPRREVMEMQQLQALADSLQNTMTRLKNMLHAFSQPEYFSPDCLLRLHHEIAHLQEAIKDNDKDLERLAQKVMPRTVEVITSLSGVGCASAIRVAAAVGDFHRFPNARKLVSYMGISPTIKQSGISVKSRGHISRMGGTKIRGALYMCAISASQHNAQCRAMAERMRANKKHGKIIMVAIMNKLLRQMYSMVIHDRLYDPTLA